MKKFLILLCGLVFFVIGCGETQLIPYTEGGANKLVADSLMGYKDKHGKIVIKAKYIFAEEFNQYGIAAVADPKLGWIYINKKGQFVIKPYPYDNGYDPFVEGLARFEANDKMGFFDQRGKIIIPAQFDFAFPFENGYAAVVKYAQYREIGDGHQEVQGKWGFINKKGKLVIPYQFDDWSPFNKKGVAKVNYKGKRVLINTSGKVIEVLK